jgi:hypothetical protein
MRPVIMQTDACPPMNVPSISLNQTVGCLEMAGTKWMEVQSQHVRTFSRHGSGAVTEMTTRWLYLQPQRQILQQEFRKTLPKRTLAYRELICPQVYQDHI